MVLKAEETAILRGWRDGPFKSALKDPKRRVDAVAMLKIALEKKEPLDEALAYVIGDFVCMTMDSNDVYKGRQPKI